MNITQHDREQAKKALANFAVPKSKEEVFYHLCFCVCVPQTTWKKTTEVIAILKKYKFYSTDMTSAELEVIVKPCRFYRRKSEYLQHLKTIFPYVYSIILGWKRGNVDDITMREKLVKGLKGIGLKTASHFMRNMGGTKLAILDTHILQFLKKTEKSVTRRKYLLYEQLFELKALQLDVSVAELDIIIWKHCSNTDWENIKY